MMTNSPPCELISKIFTSDFLFCTIFAPRKFDVNHEFFVKCIVRKERGFARDSVKHYRFWYAVNTK